MAGVGWSWVPEAGWYPPITGFGVPILNLSGNLGLWELDVDGAVAWSGANLAQVCRAAARSGLGGFDALMAASGTVGGAIHAAQRAISRSRGVLEWTDVARPGTPVERVVPTTWGEKHRGLTLDLERRVILRARLRLSKESLRTLRIRLADDSTQSLAETTANRRPGICRTRRSSCRGVLAETGCLGMSVGSARLCENSPNRIRSSRSARAAEILELMQRVRDRVMDKRRGSARIRPVVCRRTRRSGRAVTLYQTTHAGRAFNFCSHSCWGRFTGFDVVEPGRRPTRRQR